MTRRPRGAAIHHLPPRDIASDAPIEALREEFARRLQNAMAEKGFNQTELARRASDHLTTGRGVGKDSISKYVQGVQIPSPERLTALAKVLGLQTTDLMPLRNTRNESVAPPVDVRQLDNGQAWLRINQEVPWPIAVQILALLKNED